MEIIDLPTRDFISKHRNDDVRRLALIGDRYSNVNMTFALGQIQGWQTARCKLPSWASVEGIIFPPHLNMEQCSSEQTALYKHSILTSIIHHPSLTTFIDLTGGFGVDFSFMSRGFGRAIYVEHNSSLCAIARHNFRLLCISNAEVVNADASNFLRRIPKDTDGLCVFIDPSRRDSHGRKIASIAECEPNVLTMLTDLAAVADTLMLKLSPMFDWHEAVRELNTEDCGLAVSDVHIVAVRNECKELLIVMRKATGTHSTITLHCVNDDQVFETSSRLSNGRGASVSSVRLSSDPPSVSSVLYVPNAAIMNAGCFAELSEAYGVSPISRNSHLFVSSEPIDDFPGRRFQILAVSSMNKKDLRRNMAGITRANIAVRNFPIKADELRKRLKIADGGDVYIFATTTQDGNHILIISKKSV